MKNETIEEDIIFDTESTVIEDATVKLSTFEIVTMNSLFKRAMIIIGLALLWEIVARYVNNPLMLATFSDSIVAVYDSIFVQGGDNNLLQYLKTTIVALFGGYLIGVLVAVVATIISVNTKLGEEIQYTITSLCTPLPAVAIAPIALLMFGLTIKTVLFVIAWATAFPVALNMFMGFKTSSETILFAGRNIGLKGIAYTLKIRIPDTLPAIITGLRTGFSNGFRALIALEMVIGAATGSGGLGWFIMNGKNQLDTPLVFAGIISTMTVGILFELLFSLIERQTIKKYGMIK